MKLKDMSVIELLRHAVYWEEQFINQYDNNDIWFLIKETIPKDKAKKVSELFKKNLSDSHKHFNLTKQMLKELEGERE